MSKAKKAVKRATSAGRKRTAAATAANLAKPNLIGHVVQYVHEPERQPTTGLLLGLGDAGRLTLESSLTLFVRLDAAKAAIARTVTPGVDEHKYRIIAVYPE